MVRLTRAKAIRAKCLDCCCWQQAEVLRCPCKSCALWRFRLGKEEKDELYVSKSKSEKSEDAQVLEGQIEFDDLHP